MKRKLRDMLIPKGRTLYFNEEEHKYTNELGFTYTSTTTLIGKYCPEEDFVEIAKACERIGRNPNHPQYQKYKGKFYKEIIADWKKITDESCAFGTIKHNFLECAVKTSNQFFINAKGFIDGQIYTIDDILFKHNYGRVKLEVFERSGVKEKYPIIYNILLGFHNLGYHIYAEIGVYDDTYGISGLIDILCVNHKTYEFAIVDWKTNKAPIKYEAGYFKKDEYGLLDLNNWVDKDKVFKYPLEHLADSVGNHYSMQLSIYAYLVSTWGFKLTALILCHIRPIEERYQTRDYWKEVVEPYPIAYLEPEVKSILNDWKMKNIKTQGTLQFL